MIEPAPNLFLSCYARRGLKNSIFCNACVPFDYTDEFVDMKYSDSMTISKSLDLDIADLPAHTLDSKRHMSERECIFEFGAKSATLTELLVKANSPQLIDFLSLDIEGAELDVLKGLDFEKYNFKYMVIECRDIKKLRVYLEKYDYALLEKITLHDYLFKYEKWT